MHPVVCVDPQGVYSVCLLHAEVCVQGSGSLLLLHCRAELEVHDTVIGPGKQDYMHGIVGGATTAPPLVCLPGYGAGAAFFFRNFPSLCQYFRTYAVDPLGTGMSGVYACYFGTLWPCYSMCMHIEPIHACIWQHSTGLW